MIDFNMRDLISAGNTLGTFAIGIWLYLEKRSDKTNDRISETNKAVAKVKEDSEKAVDALRIDTGKADQEIQQGIEARLDAHGEQLAHLEAKAEGAPTHQDLSELHKKINAVAEGQGRLEGTVGGIDTNVRQVLSRIMERGLP